MSWQTVLGAKTQFSENHLHNLHKSLEYPHTLNSAYCADGLGENSISEKPRRYAYHFALHGGEGSGTLLTDESDLEAARVSLEQRYGARLATVTATSRIPENHLHNMQNNQAA